MSDRRRRSARGVRVAGLVAVLAAGLAGCGDSGGLLADGRAPVAVGPATLWPDLRPASSPAYPYDVASRETVQGIRVPGDGIRAVDPVAVVTAELAAHPDDYGSKGAYHSTVDGMKNCAEGARNPKCPLLKAYYRDLTGDGRDDLTLGFHLGPTNQTAVRVYTAEGHALVRVLADNDAITGVELAGRSVIVRSPAEISGYEYRTTWEWDAEQRAMVFTRDEFLRTGGGTAAPGASASPSPGRNPNTPPGAP
ncbi:hypothetical protein [Streptomyces sp. NPDC003688]